MNATHRYRTLRALSARLAASNAAAADLATDRLAHAVDLGSGAAD